MLQNLHVKNLALIDEAEVDFQKGLNILTGETGAGKSIILGSINLALGGKYSADLLRKGASYGLVELVFQLEKEQQIEALKRLDVFPEEGQLILSRKLMEGKSISRINGETVSMKKLKEISEVLIDIHGQHEHQSLLYKKNHLTILDAFSKGVIDETLSEVKEAYRNYRAIREELEQAVLDEASRAKELDFLEFEVAQIRETNPKPGEDVQLEEEFKRMLHGKKIKENIEEAYEYTGDGQTGINDGISRAMRCLLDAANYDDRAKALSDQLVEIDNLLNDFRHDLSEYKRTLEFSEEDFLSMQERLNTLNRLKAKYGQTLEEVLAYCEQQEKRVETLRDYDQYLEQLRKNYEIATAELERVSQRLTFLRKEQAKKLEKMIRDGLLDLNFLEVKFEIAFEMLKDFTPTGKDGIEFLISMNPGEPVRPLGEIASGGELSRIMLAIKTVLADKDDVETLIFDEIDVGISGRTAQKVSEKMKVIGENHQVLCITHLAQIAAMADAHYAIEKKVVDGQTRTIVKKLKEEESVEEIARILGGAEITDTVLQNAMEMKTLANQFKRTT